MEEGCVGKREEIATWYMRDCECEVEVEVLHENVSGYSSGVK